MNHPLTESEADAPCDKCHGNPGADLGGCFRCGGSGLAKDHQPDLPDAGDLACGRRDQ